MEFKVKAGALLLFCAIQVMSALGGHRSASADSTPTVSGYLPGLCLSGPERSLNSFSKLHVRKILCKRFVRTSLWDPKGDRVWARNRIQDSAAVREKLQALHAKITSKYGPLDFPFLGTADARDVIKYVVRGVFSGERIIESEAASSDAFAGAKGNVDYVQVEFAPSF